VARSRRRPGRDRGAVLAQAWRGGGDPGARGGAGDGADTGAVAAVLMKLAGDCTEYSAHEHKKVINS